MLVCLMIWQKHQYFLKKVPLLKIMNDNVHIIQLNGWWLLRFLIAYGSPNHYTSWFGFGLFKNCMHLKTVQMSVFAIKVNINPIIWIFFGSKGMQNQKFRFFHHFSYYLTEFGQIKQKVENGSCSRHSYVNQHDFKWMYDTLC